ncbi:MAG: hypothetical protein HYR60_03685 [Acidobacteria bacterium]|nr:hypothetical protein [Acidobacteriota bacterium]MBI3472775.1 hypothetical protein [Candidatus Solibacter usitatus]
MAATKPLKQRVDRLERLIASLARETRIGFQQVTEQFRLVSEQFNQVDERFRQIAAQSEKTDERIDRLVVAIGELIRSQQRNGKR